MTRAPELDQAIAWLNVERPLTMRELRGQLVVLDFWTYCCINCMHVAPTLKAIEHALDGEPLVVIGVHSGKFDAERDPARIAEAVARYQIEHPIAVDDGMELWSRYAIRSWPTLVVVRPDGTIAAVAPGEPERELLEGFLRRELELARQAGTLAKEPFRVPQPKRAADRVLSYPGKIAVAADGRLAVADSGHHRVLVTSPNGEVIACAGSGLSGLADGKLAEAAFDDPQGLAWNGPDRLIVADARNHALREIDLGAGEVRTLAGTGELGLRMPKEPRPAREVALRSPWDVAVDGELTFVAMAGSHQIFVFVKDGGTLVPMAGTGAEGLVDGPFRDSVFAQPSGLWLDRKRRRLYLADSETSSVRYLDLATKQVVTLVGEGLFTFGDRDGALGEARLQHDLGVCGSGGFVYVADTYNSKIKRIDEARGTIETIYGGHGELAEPGGLCFGGDGTLYISDTNHHRIVRLDVTARRASEVAITGAPQPLSGIASAAKRTTAAKPHGAAGWFTAHLVLPDGAALSSGDRTIALELTAPDGLELAAGSPLSLELEVSRRPDLLHLDAELHTTAAGGRTHTLRIPARIAALPGMIESEVVASLRFVACDKLSVCTPGEARLRIPIRLAPNGGAELAFAVPLPQIGQ